MTRPTSRLSSTERKTQIIRLLKTRPRTAEEIAIATSTATTTIRRYLAELRGQRAHILDWVPAKGGLVVVALWASGPGADAPQPQSHSIAAQDAETDSKRRRAIMHADDMAYELSKLPAANPIQALVTATLFAEHRERL